MNSREFKDNSISRLLFHAADQWPDKPAITFSGATQSWLETRNRCHAAATLFHRLGVGTGVY